MWDLPGTGLESMSPALAGRFLTTAPPGKSPVSFLDWPLCHFDRDHQCPSYHLIKWFLLCCIDNCSFWPHHPWNLPLFAPLRFLFLAFLPLIIISQWPLGASHWPCSSCLFSLRSWSNPTFSTLSFMMLAPTSTSLVISLSVFQAYLANFSHRWYHFGI